MKAGYVEYGPAEIKLPIQFTAKSGMFSCTYAGTRYEDTQIGQLRERVLAAMKSTYTLNWTPLIELGFPVSSRSWHCPHFALSKERKYITHHQNFGYKQVHWAATQEARLASSRPFPWRADEAFITPTSRESHGQLVIYLPYSEVTWAEIEEIETYLHLASQKLRKGFSDPEQINATLAMCRMLFDHYATQEKTDEESRGE